MSPEPTAKLALSRKYRPSTFGGPTGAVGQEHVATTLRHQVAKGEIFQSYLFKGTGGIGKTTFARVLAAAANCEQRTPEGEPCGQCDSCRPIIQGHATMDVVEIDAASNRGVDDAKELRERVQYAPSAEGRHKFYIIDEAHMLTKDAWNVLLKTLEEPPPNVHFVFATTEAEKINKTAQPILSRCQVFEFRPIAPSTIVEYLRYVAELEGIKITKDALVRITRASKIGMRDALTKLEQVVSAHAADHEIDGNDARAVLSMPPEDAFLAAVDLLAERDPEKAQAKLGKMMKYLRSNAIEPARFVAGVTETLFTLGMLHGGVEPDDWSEKGAAGLRARLGTLTLPQIATIVDRARTVEADLRRAENPEIVAWAFMQLSLASNRA